MKTTQGSISNMTFTLMVLCSFVAVSSAGHLTYTNCNTSPNIVIHFTNAHLSSDPVHIPGPETVNIDVQVLRPIEGNHYKLNLNIQKKASTFWITIPCPFSNFPIGSCSYELCDLLSGKNYSNTHHCPLQIKESSPDFPCACPFAAGNYHLNPTTFTIPEPSGLWSFYAGGDYKVHATLTDTTTNEQVGCYDINFSTETGCSGFGCIFG